MNDNMQDAAAPEIKRGRKPKIYSQEVINRIFDYHNDARSMRWIAQKLSSEDIKISVYKVHQILNQNKTDN